jgi:hypothetical protein|nr:YiaA/YiaB family inner membrane protein [uncultured Albidiferax sp.]
MASAKYIMQRDTTSWRMQTRISFAAAVACCAAGILQLPSQELDRAFLAIGMFFCLFATLALAKTIRDNRDGQVDTGAWVMTVWAAFAAASALTAWGLWRMQIDVWQKGFMGVSWLYLISSTFTLSKTVRDKQEADLMDQGGAVARAEE